MSRQKNKEKDELSHLVWGFFTAGILGLGGIFFLYFVTSPTASYFSTDTAGKEIKVEYGDPLISPARLQYPRVDKDDPTQGSSSAVVNVFYFCDLLSPLCTDQQEQINIFLNDFDSEKVRIIWKGTASSPQSLLVQQAAYCAHKQDAFWPYQMKLLTASFIPSVSDLNNFAADLDLDVEVFQQCLNLEISLDKVYANNQAALDLQIDQVPYFYVNYKSYSGFLTASQLKEIIQENL